MRVLLIFTLCWWAVLNATAQSDTYFCVSLNTNIVVPTAKSERYTYPIYGLNADLADQHMIGGFGLQFSFTKPITDKLEIKPYLHLSRIKYWDESTYNQWNSTLFYTIGTSYILGVGGLVQVEIPGSIKLGAGLASQTQLKATSKAAYAKDLYNVRVNSYKTILLTLPIEVGYAKDKMQYAVRYEHPLMNAYRASLSEYLEDRYGVVYFSVGYRIK
jgi:hypothetical protein